MSSQKTVKKTPPAAKDGATKQNANPKKGQRPTNTDPNKQPGFDEQEAALRPQEGEIGAEENAGRYMYIT